MQKLISELKRLYLPAGAVPDGALERHVLGQDSAGVALVSADGNTRALAIPFLHQGGGEETQHWTLLCAVANAMQVELGLPAPAVSISGAHGYGLWLSFEAPLSVAMAQQLGERLRKAYFPDAGHGALAASAPLPLPPCLHAASGKWAAFIHPGLGASFAGEAGLEMAPPFAGQAALLQELESISQAQFEHAMQALGGPAANAPVEAPAASAPGLLLKDASLEDIVRHLHAKDIEPTFRHIIKR